jgi:Holliday junction resolvase-like predicted endonuclease
LLANPGIKILELTKARRRIALDELAEQLYTKPEKLLEIIGDLTQTGLISCDRHSLEVDSAQRLMLATRLVHVGCDPQKVSRYLEWQEFEKFAAESLEENGFRTVKHLVFKSKLGRREIDLLAWNDSFLMAIDCKHWLRGLSTSTSLKVARAQGERAEALAGRVEILKKCGVDFVEKRYLIPVILCMAEPRNNVVDGVPIVPVSKLINFLYGVSPIDEVLRRIPVKSQMTQSSLL